MDPRVEPEDDEVVRVVATAGPVVAEGLLLDSGIKSRNDTGLMWLGTVPRLSTASPDTEGLSPSPSP